MSLSLKDWKEAFWKFPVKVDFGQAKDISGKVLDANSKPPFPNRISGTWKALWLYLVCGGVGFLQTLLDVLVVGA